MRKLFKHTVAGAVLAGSFAIAGQASALVMIDTGGGNFAGDSNVVFNACGGNEVSGPSMTVTGCLNDDSNFLVDFMGMEDLVIPSGGQARVESADGNGFEYLKISAHTLLGAADFATLITNINASDFITGPAAVGFVEITPYIGGIAGTTETFSMSDGGENFFRLWHDNDDLFSAVEFQAVGGFFDAVDFADFRQTRLGGLQGAEEVLEPAPLALLGLGLLALGAAKRKSMK